MAMAKVAEEETWDWRHQSFNAVTSAPRSM